MLFITLWHLQNVLSFKHCDNIITDNCVNKLIAARLVWLVGHLTMDWFMFFCVFIVSIMAKNVDGYHLQGRIIDGNEAKLRQFPYHASLYKIKDQNYFCGGAIINRRFILSTAHCFFNNKRRSAESIFALAGQVDLKRRTNTRLKFARICLHAQFNPKYNWNDIALLQTTDNIIFTEYVRPIALPKLNIVGEVSAVVSGFGSILVWFSF